MMGKGTEKIENYENTRLVFMNIDNIHAVRDSFNGLMRLCNEDPDDGNGANLLLILPLSPPSFQPPSCRAFSSHAPRSTTDIPWPGSDDNFLSRLADTGWLMHVRIILEAAVRMVDILQDEAASIVCHCSDGWDRTSQATSLVKLLLDPFYRSVAYSTI
jgi:myotubularin-related protein 1/2